MPDHLERRVPADNIARFYRLDILPTLFGDWAVQRSWGRIGTFGCHESFATAAKDTLTAIGWLPATSPFAVSG